MHERFGEVIRPCDFRVMLADRQTDTLMQYFAQPPLPGAHRGNDSPLIMADDQVVWILVCGEATAASPEQFEVLPGVTDSLLYTVSLLQYKTLNRASTEHASSKDKLCFMWLSLRVGVMIWAWTEHECGVDDASIELIQW